MFIQNSNIAETNNLFNKSCCILKSYICFIFKAHQIMNIYQMNKYITCILMYKHNRGMLQNIYIDLSMKHTPSHTYNMRQYIAYKKTHCKTNTKQNPLTYVGPTLWNIVIMKNNIDEYTSMNIFKKTMKHDIMKNILIIKTIKIQWYNSA